MAEDTKKSAEAAESPALHKDMGLKLDHRYSFRSAASTNFVVGVLKEVTAHGYIVRQDSANHDTFLPMHGVFAIEPA